MPPSSAPSVDLSLDEPTQIAFMGVTRSLASVGRAFVCLDSGFRIVHASYLLDSLPGDGTSSALRGRRIEELLGMDLFGPAGALREALLERHKREGWRAILQFKDSAQRLVSVTTAPILPDAGNLCDPRMMYIVLLRPAEEETMCSDGPTSYSGAIASSPAMQRISHLVVTLEHAKPGC